MSHHSAMRRLLVLLPFVLSISAYSETFKVDVTIGGKAIGSENWDVRGDGTFDCTSNWDIPGQKILSKLSGKLEKEKIGSFAMDLTANGNAAKVTWDGAKYKVEAGGKTVLEKPLTFSGGAFSNYHIQLLRTVLAGYNASAGGRQALDAMVLEGGVTTKLNVTRLNSSQVTVRGKPIGVTRWIVEVGLAQIQIAQGEDGRILGGNVPSQQFKAVIEGYDEVFVDPTSKYPELSQPTLKAKLEKGVKTPMRDGVNLVADVVRPDTDGKFPVILSRTPYGRAGAAFLGDWWAKRGYAFVSQDCRGRGDSDGDWVPFENERKDGYDTVEWIAKQPWCDGNVGMIGASYGGLVQWAAAVEHPMHLKCIIPQVSPPDGFHNIPYDFGVFFLYGNIWWGGIVRDKDAKIEGFGLQNIDGLKTLPLDKVDDKVWGRNLPFFDSWLKRESSSQYPGFNYENEVATVRLPVLMISGWFDGDGIGTKLNWAEQKKGGNPNRWLIYGPWTHIFNATSSIGDTSFGRDSVLDLDSVYLRFFDTYLKSKKVGQEKTPRVQAFVMGSNKWKYLDDWPASNSKEMSLYLAASGPANGRASKGELVEGPAKVQAPSKYSYDPHYAPIPEELRNVDPSKASFTIDLTQLRDDELFFRTAPLGAPREIGGPISAEIYFSTSAKDTDFFATLVDIDEKGKGRAIGTPGKIRAKYLSGMDHPKLLTPGKVYKATIELWDTAHRFEKGHRIGLIIDSSKFPLYARNLNTGEPLYGATRMVVAKQSVYHDAAHPSVLKFRLLPPG